MEISRILLADDDPLIRRISEVSLKRAGFTVRLVADGTDAMTQVELDAPDLVILDGMMPKLDGFEACRRLKANPATSHIPVIILSARTDTSDVEEGQAAGAVGYIQKPIDALSLGEQVREICRTVARAS
jgi:DNA-binding response OmpR family regulator